MSILMDVEAQVNYWKRFIDPDLSMDEFKEQYNLLNVEKWYNELDYSMILACINGWYKRYKPYLGDKSYDDFVKDNELQNIVLWNIELHNNMEMKLITLIKNYSYKKITDWYIKFKHFELDISKDDFMSIFGINGSTKWTEELETIVVNKYNEIIIKVKDEKYNVFIAMWPKLTRDMFDKLYDEDLDLNAEFQTMFMNVELYHKLMEASYNYGLYYSYNRMIHELDITAEHPCNEDLDNKISSLIK